MLFDPFQHGKEALAPRFDRHRQPLFQAELLLEALLSQPEGGARFRGDVVLEVLDVRADRLRGLGLRVGKVADVVKQGYEVKVKVLGFDDRGKVKLSMKMVDQATGEDLSKQAQAE